MFHSSPQGVPISNPFFYEGITKDSDSKGFDHHWGGGGQRREINMGSGEGKDIVVIEKFQSPQSHGD
jgi:hypothetical protein